MATRFLRIDLADEARDFRPVALEPGVPVLDRSGANAKILYRWLGGMVAEPVWEGDSVSFFVRDDHGGRLEDAVCQTATREDLESTLQEDLATLKDRLNSAKPETPTERMVKKMVRRSLEELTEDPNRTDLDCYFFRYRDANERWRLVWCWGFQRVDPEPAPAVICTDPECTLLFVRRPGQSPRCPCCEASLSSRPVRKKRGKRNLLLVLLLLLIAAGLYYWWTHPTRLIATPTEHKGPVGGRVEFKITRAGLFSEEDVTGQAMGVVFDPAVARFDQTDCAVTFAGPGKTLIRFHLGELDPIDVELTAVLPTNPNSIAVQPDEVTLGIGTTARLKLIGTFDDGTEVDLTAAAEWEPAYEGPVYARGGFLEGLAEGSAKVAVKYRADADSDYLNAEADVTVKEIDFASLNVAVDPQEVGLGRANALKIDAVTEDGEAYSVLESSLLATDVAPDYVAVVEGRRLAGRQLGSGTLKATFNDSLEGEGEFEVVVKPGLDRLVVQPENLRMAVGQIADLSIVSPSNAPIRVTSADSDTVEVTRENRLIGRAEGEVKVTVKQSGQDSPVDVTVTVVAAEFRSIAIDPPSIVVPVDGTLYARVVATARLAGDEADRFVEITPDAVVCEGRPSPHYADFYPKTLGLHGVLPTEPSSPQTLALRFQSHRASAPVEVVVAPFRLSLTPSGEVSLPLGQQMRMKGWATYSGGRRVEVAPSRLSLTSQPGDGFPGKLELRGNRIAALEEGAGPLSVIGRYFSKPSKPVQFHSVGADPSVKLRLDVDRTLRLAGETGRVTLAATSSAGDVELVPELSQFASSDTKVLSIGETSGAFRAMAPGAVDVTGSHAAATDDVRRSLSVYDPADARLIFDPNAVRLAVDEIGRLPLYLEVQDAGQTKRAELVGPEVGYLIERPQAIRFTPPTLVGASPAAKFGIQASFYPYLNEVAQATVEVTAAAEPEAIRIVPAAGSLGSGQKISLAPGQTMALAVQQQLPGEPNKWREVQPEAVAWTVPDDLVWTPAADGLRPTASVPQDGEGEYELTAGYGGQEAIAVIAAKTQAPDPNAAGVEVQVLRDPPGEYLPVGASQQYTIVINNQGVVEPAANVRWPEDFENEYVRWQAPVLTAKQPGHRQTLRAEVSGRTVLFSTTTYVPGQFQPPKDRPIAVRILSDQIDERNAVVRFPVGAEFDDFRVEAEYPDGIIRYVAVEATLTTPEPPNSAYLSADGGLLVGLRPGRTEVHAEFEGVRSMKPLPVEVLAELDVDNIAIVPAPIGLQPGESYPLEVYGSKGGKSVGRITSLAAVTFEASNPAVARVDGPVVTGVKAGQGTVTARFGQLVSAPAEVNVGTIADTLAVEPGAIRIRVGQGVRVGTEVAVTRGEMDVSQMCTVSPAFSETVEYLPQTQTLVGRAPGTTAVAFTLGDKLMNLLVEVVPAGDVIDGAVIIEPSGGTLAPGQALPMRVMVVNPDTGERLDRTDSAVLKSDNPAAVAIRGNRACALGPGQTGITASVYGTDQTGSAFVTVNNEPITELIVEPPQAAMSVGDVTRLRILGRASSGTHELFVQPDLTVTAGGANPAAIRIDAGSDVYGVAPGQANVAVAWKQQLNRDVPITVRNDVLTDLQITPADATITPGQPLGYQVTGMRGGQRRVLGPEHGVQLFVGEQDIAQVARDALAVRGVNPGRTSVVARLGDQQAVAALQVVPGGVATIPGTGVIGPGVIGPGTGVQIYDPNYIGVPGGWRDKIWVDGGPGTVIDPTLIDPVYVAPPANAEGLRFVPEVLRLAANAPPTGFRVIEVLADGTDGRDVTADPALELQAPNQNIVSVGKAGELPVVQPTGQAGEARVGARLGNLTAHPMLVSVGGVAAGTGRLIVEPNPLTVWTGEATVFADAVLAPGGGQPPRPTDYRIISVENPALVKITDGKAIRGLSPGTTRVVVAAVDPGGVQGATTTATIQVVNSSEIEIVPNNVSLRIGQTTPPLAVVTRGQDGVPYQVPAKLESMDENVLAPSSPSGFTARTLGGTEIRATYRGKQAFASVTVSGQRFVQVSETINRGTTDFGVTLDVLAAASEKPLEYRVYVAGQAPGDGWTAATAQSDGTQKATIHSPRVPYGLPNSLHNLMIEARAADGSDPVPQRYPLTLRQIPGIERADNRQPNP